MIIDSHIHLYPSAVYQDPVDWARQRGEDIWSQCVAPPNRLSLQGWSTVDQLLRDMDEARIDRAVILSWYWQSFNACRESFGWQRQWIAAHPDRLMAMAPFHPAGGQEALDLLQEALDLGFRGIGELHPPAQGYAFDDPLFLQALDLAAQARIPINLHVTEPAGRPYPGRVETPFQDLQRLCRERADNTFILAHLGGLLPLFELNRQVAKDLRNVYYDTAAVPLLYRKRVYRMICDAIGAERLLFGTDYPLRSFPKRQPLPSFAPHLQSLRSSDLRPDELERILGTNAQRLFHLSPAQTP